MIFQELKKKQWCLISNKTQKHFKSYFRSYFQTSKAWGKIFNTKIMEEPTYTFTWQCHPTMSKRRLCISPNMTTLNNTKMCLESMKILLISFCFSLHHPPSPLPSYNVRGWFFFIYSFFKLLVYCNSTVTNTLCCNRTCDGISYLHDRGTPRRHENNFEPWNCHTTFTPRTSETLSSQWWPLSY